MSIFPLLGVVFSLASGIGSTRGSTRNKSEGRKKERRHFSPWSSLPLRSPGVGHVPRLKATSPIRQPPANSFPLQALEKAPLQWSAVTSFREHITPYALLTYRVSLLNSLLEYGISFLPGKITVNSSQCTYHILDRHGSMM